jgi:hypothetical protein
MGRRGSGGEVTARAMVGAALPCLGAHGGHGDALGECGVDERRLCEVGSSEGVSSVGDIPNGYTSDVVLNQQARVAHQGGMADCLPGGPVAGETMAVLDAGAYGGSGDGPMAGCLVVHA